MKLKGRTAVITGGASEVGRAIAAGFAKEGAAVVIVDINEAGAEESLHAVLNAGSEGMVIAADVTDPERTDEMVRQTVEKFGAIDILVTASAANSKTDMMEITQEEWDHIINATLSGVMYCVQSCARQMVKQKSGSMVIVSSLAAFRGRAGQVAYCAAESALCGFAANTAVQLGEHGIRVNSLALGILDTDTLESLKDDPEYRDIRITHTPLLRPGRPEDVVGPAVFLAGDDSAFITGETLKVDGGISIYVNGHGL